MNERKPNTNIEQIVGNANNRVSVELTDQLWDLLKSNIVDWICVSRWTSFWWPTERAMYSICPNCEPLSKQNAIIPACSSYETLKEAIEFILTSAAKINVVVCKFIDIFFTHYDFEITICLLKSPKLEYAIEPESFGVVNPQCVGSSHCHTPAQWIWTTRAVAGNRLGESEQRLRAYIHGKQAVHGRRTSGG